MTPKKYIKEALKTETVKMLFLTAQDTRVLHGAIGVCTEAGELLDAVKKHLFYGKKPDKINMVEEIGDIFWYCAILCDALGASFEEVMDMNIAKLRKRYGYKFTESSANNRDLAAEREVLEGGE